MNYDTWKATNPADEFLGVDPIEEELTELEDRIEVCRDLVKFLQDEIARLNRRHALLCRY